MEDNHRLIASDRVEGTAVYSKDGEKLGTVRKMMIEKRSGSVRHVIVGYGGLFGLGEANFPLPWDALEYDEDRDGYVSKVDSERMRGKDAPRYETGREPDWNAEYQRGISLYYLPMR